MKKSLALVKTEAAAPIPPEVALAVGETKRKRKGKIEYGDIDFPTSREKAWREAKRLAEELGSAWVPEVFENLGWHAKAVLGGLSVSPGSRNSYSAFLNHPGEIGGRWADGGRTPFLAVRAVLEKAINEYNDDGKIIRAALQQLQRSKNRKGR